MREFKAGKVSLTEPQSQAQCGSMEVNKHVLERTIRFSSSPQQKSTYFVSASGKMLEKAPHCWKHLE